MSDTLWMIVIICSALAIIGAILEVRFVLRRRDHRLSEELNGDKEDRN